MYRLKQFISLLLVSCLLFTLSANVFAVGQSSIDNSALLKYEGDCAELTLDYTDGLIGTPEWVDSLIIVEVRPDTASIGGTLPECYDLIDFYASLGVNGIWLSPIYDRGGIGNGYSNCGPHTLDPAITGTDDYEEGWQIVKEFIDYAHSKGIYVFLDVITWGVVKTAPLLNEHPEWFNGEAWGNIAFDWSNTELQKWFTETLVNNILVTGADGYRCDCEPNYAGYEPFRIIREKLAEEGRNIVLISEDTSSRSSVFDFEQDGVFDYSVTDRGGLYQNPLNFYTDGYLNIVDSVKSGEGIGHYARADKRLKQGTSRYYTHCITNHDYQRRYVKGDRIKIGYSAIFAPFIPIWYMGDEFNATNPNGVLYDLSVDFSEAQNEENATFLEDVKKMINIRRTYSEIFEYFPKNHRRSNICEVNTSGFGTLQNYARFMDNKAILIVANNSPDSSVGEINVPFRACNLNYYKTYTVTDLMTGEVIKEGTAEEIATFTAEIEYSHVGAFLVEGNEVRNQTTLEISVFFKNFVEMLAEKFLDFINLFVKL